MIKAAIVGYADGDLFTFVFETVQEAMDFIVESPNTSVVMITGDDLTTEDMS